MSNVSTTTAAIYQAVLDSLNSSGECGVLPPAPPGKSAYEVAVDNGFVGSEKQWIDSLQYEQQQEIARLEARIVANEKFTKDSKYAASRLVGSSSGQVPVYTHNGLSGMGYGGVVASTGFVVGSSEPSERTIEFRDYIFSNSMGSGFYYAPPTDGFGGSTTPSILIKGSDRYSWMNIHHYSGVMTIASGTSSSDVKTTTVWSTANTTTDVNKNIKSSSPVLQVFKDGVKKIHEANQLPIKFTRNGVGDYTIEGTTGLRENDWQIVIPEDDHKNQLIAFTIEDDNGTIHLKTYKRTFSVETFLFGPDLKSPVEIPDGLWVDLHFNDLPQEQLDEPEPVEEEPKD